MRKVILILLCWELALGGHCGKLAAQGRAAGPWRVVRQPVRYKLHNDWDSAEEWGERPLPAAKTDTATAVRVQRKLRRVPWNVHPDSVTLFLDCQNLLLAPAAPHGLVSVRFEATGATVRLNAKQQLLLLVPSAPVAVLLAYRGRQLLFRHEFRAVPPPLPTIKCYPGGCVEANDVPAGEKQVRHTLTLRSFPEKDFAEALPEDARYRVARFRATLLRQGKPVELAPGQLAAKTVQGPQGDIRDLTSTSQPGDQLQVDVLLVQRQSASGSITEVPVTRRFILNEPTCPSR